MTHFRLLILSAALMALPFFLTSSAHAQDPVKLAPTVYKVAFENERVRVLEVRLEPGEKAPMHEHPDSIIYIISPGKLRFTFPDKNKPPMISEAKIGEVIFRGAEKHAVENIGVEPKTEVNTLVIELKEPRPPAKAADIKNATN